MKKIYYLFAVLAFSSCTNEEILNEQPQFVNDEVSSFDINKRSYKEVVEIAQNSISILQDSNALTRGMNEERTLNLRNGIKAICQPSTRGNGTIGNDTLLYIFNFNDSKGFAVVSANRYTEGLIAVVENGEYDPNVPSENPVLDMYIKNASNYVASVQGEPEIITRASLGYKMYKPQYDTLYYNKVEPKLKVAWGQQEFAGQYCPNKKCGCANTAAAQIMSYFGYKYGVPRKITLTYPNRDVNETKLEWSKICSVKRTNDIYNYSLDLNICRQIGRLTRQLGHLSESKYKDQTSTDINGIKKALAYFGSYNISTIMDYKPFLTPNHATDSNAGIPLATALAADKLILMGGVTDDKTGDKVGHAWVVDGCYYVRAVQRLMVSTDGVNWKIDRDVCSYQTSYNHINWGWNGHGNGYFHEWIFNATNPVSYDSNTNYNAPNVSFTSNMKYITVGYKK